MNLEVYGNGLGVVMTSCSKNIRGISVFVLKILLVIKLFTFSAGNISGKNIVS